MTLITYFIRVLSNKSEFYTVNEKQYKMINNKVSNGSVGFISFALDKNTIEYERVVYSFIDMFGFLGGLYDFVFFCGYMSIICIQNKLFNYALFSRLYHLEAESSENLNSFNCK